MSIQVSPSLSLSKSLIKSEGLATYHKLLCTHCINLCTEVTWPYWPCGEWRRRSTKMKLTTLRIYTLTLKSRIVSDMMIRLGIEMGSSCTTIIGTLPRNGVAIYLQQHDKRTDVQATTRLWGEIERHAFDQAWGDNCWQTCLRLWNLTGRSSGEEK